MLSPALRKTQTAPKQVLEQLPGATRPGDATARISPRHTRGPRRSGGDAELQGPACAGARSGWGCGRGGPASLPACGLQGRSARLLDSAMPTHPPPLAAPIPELPAPRGWSRAGARGQAPWAPDGTCGGSSSQAAAAVAAAGAERGVRAPGPQSGAWRPPSPSWPPGARPFTSHLLPLPSRPTALGTCSQGVRMRSRTPFAAPVRPLVDTGGKYGRPDRARWKHEAGLGPAGLGPTGPHRSSRTCRKPGAVAPGCNPNTVGVQGAKIA